MTNIHLPTPSPLKIPFAGYTNFNHIKPIRISDSLSALTNYQIKIELNGSNFDLERIRSDGNDIRLIDENGEVLSFWLESISSFSAIIWCKIPEIFAGKDKYIWLIYGNPSASSASNGDATFELFDDFPGESLDTNKWTEELKGTGASVNVTGGECELDVPDDQICSANIQSINTFINDIAIRVKRKCPNDDEYIGLSLGSGDVCAYDGGSTNWFITSKHSGYFFSIQLPAGGGLQGIVEMPPSGSGVRIGSEFIISAADLNNYNTFEYIYDSLGNLKWYIDKYDVRPLGEGFEKYASNPLSIPDYGMEYGAIHPDMVYFPAGEDGYKYWLFYETVDSEPAEHLDLVRSNDGISFVDTDISNHILSPDAPGSWDDKYVADGSIVKVGSTWYMYYCGVNTSDKCKIGLATSTDGKNWSRITDGIDGTSKVLEPNVGLTEEAGDKFVSPAVYYDGTKYWMWYISKKSGTDYCMCLANSTDGKNWTKSDSNPVYDPGGEIIWHIDVTKHDGYYYCYFSHGSVGHLRLLKSTDKTTWNLADNDPVLEYTEGWEGTHIYESGPAADAYGNLELIDNIMWMYYSTRGGTGDYYEIGLAKSWENINVGAELLDSAIDTTFLSDNKKILITQGAYSLASRGAPSFLDFALVRKYASPEPTIEIL